MSYEIESNEKNVAKVKLVIPKEAFEAAMEAVYQKKKGMFVIDGFRKGKVPRAMLERRYGKNLFYEDALEEAFPEVYKACVEQEDFKTVAAPKLLSVDEIGENGATLTVEVSLEPQFELQDYKGIKIGSQRVTVKKSDIEAGIKQIQEQNARSVSLEDGRAENGDELSINFEGFIDDVPFEGGKAENYPLVLGSNSFIPGFEEQLIGAKKGAGVDVKVNFPKQYHSEQLAGKEAVFKVEVLNIARRELPVIDDEFAKDLGYDDMEALTKSVKEKLKAEKEAAMRGEARAAIMDKLLTQTDIDIPPQMLSEKVDETKQNYESRIKGSGIDPETYYKYIFNIESDKDESDQINKLIKAQVEKDIKTDLILEKIVALEKIEATEDDLENEYKNLAASYKQPIEEFKKSLNSYLTDYLKTIIAQNKAYDFLVDNADTTVEKAK